MNVVAGNWGYPIRFIPQTGDGLIDFTDATSCILSAIDPVTGHESLFTMTIDSTSSATYITMPGDFNSVGAYKLQAQVTYPDKYIQSQQLPFVVGNSNQLQQAA